jgi:FdhD protein
MARDRIRQFDVTAHTSGDATPRTARVAVEEPLELRIDGVPLAVVMRTPGDDLELAAGFLFAEEILRSSDDIGTIAHCRSGVDPDLANVVDVRLAP